MSNRSQLVGSEWPGGDEDGAVHELDGVVGDEERIHRLRYRRRAAASNSASTNSLLLKDALREQTVSQWNPNIIVYVAAGWPE